MAEEAANLFKGEKLEVLFVRVHFSIVRKISLSLLGLAELGNPSLGVDMLLFSPVSEQFLSRFGEISTRGTLGSSSETRESAERSGTRAVLQY